MSAPQSHLNGVHELPSDCYPPTDSDEESFVVLEKVTNESLREPQFSTPFSSAIIDAALELASESLISNVASLPTPPAIQLCTSAVSLGAVSNELSTDEINQRIDILIEENSRLKDALNQNNIVMKQQYDTLIKWQDDVMKVHESHKTKFDETKSYIRELQVENIQLKSKLFERRNNCTPQKLEDVASISAIKLESSKRIEEFIRKNIHQEDEIKRLNYSLQCANSEMNHLKEQLELKDNEKNVETIQYLHLQLSDLKTKLSASKMEKEVLEKKIEEIKLECIKLETKLIELQDNFDIKQQKSEEEITSLKIALQHGNEKYEEYEKIRQQLIAAQTYITDYKQDQLKKNDELINSKLLLAEQAKKIADLTKESQGKETKLEELTVAMSKLTVDKDRLNILEDQVKIYVNDFKEERNSKEKILEEKNKIVEDLNNIQRRNEELLEELEQLRTTCTFVEVTNGTTASAPPPATTTNLRNIYKCPVCGVGFVNCTALENHANRCLDLLNAVP